MKFHDIDPYYLIEHMTVGELLGLINARDDVRQMATEVVPPCSFYTTIPVPTVSTIPSTKKAA